MSTTSEDSGSSIKSRLRSSGQALAEHTLETAKNAAAGLQHTHAAYIYPLQVSRHPSPTASYLNVPPTFCANTLFPCNSNLSWVGDILFRYASCLVAFVYVLGDNIACLVCGNRHSNMFLRISSTGCRAGCFSRPIWICCCYFRSHCRKLVLCQIIRGIILD